MCLFTGMGDIVTAHLPDHSLILAQCTSSPPPFRANTPYTWPTLWHYPILQHPTSLTQNATWVGQQKGLHKTNTSYQTANKQSETVYVLETAYLIVTCLLKQIQMLRKELGESLKS
jgi:hypothetical protein